ncbi:amidase [Pollutimonas subterranea]|uniref:Amidase n=1 Tax=Pollutimonas subterranea TaxID=2045210 RepID=A0A2N4U4S8_9BURK|nr:amidase [Pollutimonas subterranea]PLC49997.1 amidase [Pollutimonas subterranea]
MKDIAFASIESLALRLQQKSITSEALTGIFLQRIDELNPKLNAYSVVFHESAMALARASDLRRRHGLALGALDGIPIAVKDLCEIEGTTTTVGSRQWEHRQSTVTADIVKKLLAAGAVILGKTQMVEFAFGGWGTNPLMGTPWNPWDMTEHRIPGGSSSGSGVAVAAGLAPCAIGTDTGGSVRTPSSLNGITGLKTTKGLICLDGTFPLSHTLDTIGPMTRTASDAALLTAALCDAPHFGYAKAMAAIRRPDAADALAGKVICVVPPAQYGIDVQDDVLYVHQSMIATLKELGAKIIVRPLPFGIEDLMTKAGKIIACEGYHVHKEYISEPSLRVGQYVRERMLSAQDIPAHEYLDLLEAQKRMKECWQAWMANMDAVLLPSTPFTAAPLSSVDESQTPFGFFTRFVNVVDACSISIPAGFDRQKLPVGMQLVGKAFDEANILAVAIAVQGVTSWHTRTPILGSPHPIPPVATNGDNTAIVSSLPIHRGDHVPG